MSLSASADVVVIGGGPGGSTCATALAQKGVRTIVLEKARFPRFHLGESLLPCSIPILRELGVLDALEPRFLRKYGARFHDDVTGNHDRFSFDTGWKSEPKYAFQVERDVFDQVLLDHARASGADVREGWTVDRVIRENGRAVGVEATSPESSGKAKVRIDARFVVDATGRDALLAHDDRATEKIKGLDQTSFFAHFDGVPRNEGLLEGDVDIVLFRATHADRPGWFWFIPFKGGVASVGAVVSKDWIHEQGSKSPDDLFRAAVASSKTATEMLSNATMRWPHVEATADFSYRVRDLAGPGWCCVGDSGGFIDPLFSTGAHIAIVGGRTAADAIVSALAGDDDAMTAWASSVREASETFILAVEAFYAGPLVDYLFIPDKHVALRRSITSLLAGDVFHDAVWIRDARKRMSEWIGARPPS